MQPSLVENIAGVVTQSEGMNRIKSAAIQIGWTLQRLVLLPLWTSTNTPPLAIPPSGARVDKETGNARFSGKGPDVNIRGFLTEEFIRERLQPLAVQNHTTIEQEIEAFFRLGPP